MAAGLGFKTFTTGEVLTAGDVNGYLMQGINVFASNVARDAAITSPQEGQFAYTKDTNSLWYYTGSAWAASGATGDIEGVTAGTGLTGGGTSGTVTLAFDVANYGGGSYAAGKNAIINGDFYINQRNFTSVTANATYTFDRWKTTIVNGGGSATVTPQTFTAGAAPVAGYEGRNFLQIVTASQSTSAALTAIGQGVENVRNFAGQTVTISFWAKAASGTPNLKPYVIQDFGTGGSPSAQVYTAATKQTITTSWARYSFNIAVPSISGKTIGTDTNSSSLFAQLCVSSGADYAVLSDVGIQNNTFQVWGVQVEAGSTATAFQTATGTIQGELAACQRYYFQDAKTTITNGYATNTYNNFDRYFHPVVMRTTPTITQTGAVSFSSNTSATTFTVDPNGSNEIATGFYFLTGASNGLTYLYRPVQWSAEL